MCVVAADIVMLCYRVPRLGQAGMPRSTLRAIMVSVLCGNDMSDVLTCPPDILSACIGHIAGTASSIEASTLFEGLLLLPALRKGKELRSEHLDGLLHNR